MIRTVAVSGYRRLSDVRFGLDTITVVTGPNGSGKSTFYRALRLLAELAADGALTSLAREGGMRAALSAERATGDPVALRLGFATDDHSYAIDLGLPQLGPFRLDPEIKHEVVWTGEVLRPHAIVAERRGTDVRVRPPDGDLVRMPWSLPAHRSIMSALADPSATPELFAMRETVRRWRFYDALRTDRDAPARRPGVATFTDVLAADGGDLAAALLTIDRVGDAAALETAVARGLGSRLSLVEHDDGRAEVGLHAGRGRPRVFGAAELSDGTLRYLLLCAALLSPRPPEFLVLNEPESSLHPDLLPAVADLVRAAARHTQVVVVTHADRLVAELAGDAAHLELADGAVTGQLRFEGPHWTWPTR